MNSNNNEIIINSTIGNTRIAIVKNQNLENIFVERPDHQRSVGNIYKGIVQNVIPGMQAAFIDIGQSINAFLPFTEIGSFDVLNNEPFSINGRASKNLKDKKINLEIGDEIIVQVIKEPFSGKGARVTTDISLPGSFMVLVPNSNYIGISKKITNKYERNRIKKIISEFKIKNIGIIARTICVNQNENNIKNDFDRLTKIWDEVKYKIDKKKGKNLIYQDFTTSDLVIRDLLTQSIEKLIIDSKPLYKRIYKLVKEIDKTFLTKIVLHKSKKPIFDKYYGIEEQIRKILKPKIWLKSGAHLIIEQTEAMAVIDVNSGRFIGKKNHEENSLKINLEAGKEIVRQLKLRDIGGLIVIDFIDLLQAKNRKKVYDEFRKHLKRDRAKVSVSEFSNFGLLEMTRQRIRASLMATLSEECELCSGVGRIASKDTVITSIENWVKRFKKKANDKRLVIHLHPTLYSYIKENKPKLINKMMWNNWLYLEFEEDRTILRDKFKVYSKKRKNFITENI